MASPSAAPARRVALDGHAYTWEEFVGRYGGLDAATIWAESGAGEVAPERRVAQDGNAYTWEEFVGCYGWVDAATIWADCGTAHQSAAA